MKRADIDPTPDAIEAALNHDDLHRKDDIVRFLKMLLAIEPPYTFLIDSPWGTGKTFFIKQIEKILMTASPAFNEDSLDLDSMFGDIAADLKSKIFLPIYFNAWEDDHFDDPVLPLLATVANAVGETKIRKTGSISALAGDIISCILSVNQIPFNTSNAVKAITGEDFLAGYKEEKQLRDNIDKLITEYLPGIADHAVIFIDELDRCRPEFAIKLLERTKTLFQLPNIIVVYSTDVTQLSRSLEGVYGPNFEGRRYLERFFDIRTQLEQITPKDYLCYKGINTSSDYLFIDTATELLAYKGASLRSLNRLSDQIASLFQYTTSRANCYRDEYAANFPMFALLPALVVLSYFDPEAWYNVRNGSDFSSVYKLAQHSATFLEQLDSCIQELENASIYTDHDQELLKAKRMAFTEGVCAKIYADTPNDPRIQSIERGSLKYAKTSSPVFKTLRAPL